MSLSPKSIYQSIHQVVRSRPHPDQEVKKRWYSSRWFARLVAALILVTVLGAGGWSLHRQQRHISEIVLRHELSRIRMSLMIYQIFYMSSPSDLWALGHTYYDFHDGTPPHRILDDMKYNTEGEMLDPFGNPYRYDGEDRRVRSSTPQYEEW